MSNLAQLRWEAKQQKELGRSRRLRAKLAEAGWIVKDRKDGYDLFPA
jgi:cysteinyl-tRNA synthetase